jgi:hypothetical protein
MPPIRDVAGYCPMGCGETLHLMGGGTVQCLAPKCPDPGAVTKVLLDPETFDVVTFTDGRFNVLHPLKERLGGELLSCPVAAKCAELAGPPDLDGGKYRAYLDEDGELVLQPVPRAVDLPLYHLDFSRDSLLDCDIEHECYRNRYTRGCFHFGTFLM